MAKDVGMAIIVVPCLVACLVFHPYQKIVTCFCVFFGGGGGGINGFVAEMC